MRIKLCACAVAACLLLSSCAGPTGLESPKHPFDFRGYSGPDREGVDMANKISILDTAIENCRKVKLPDESFTCRNQVVGELKEHITVYWNKFKSEFFGRVGITNLAFDGITATTSAAAGITSPVSAKNILTAFTTSLLAFRSSAQKNLLGDQAIVPLLGQMDHDRLVLNAKIDLGLSKSIAEYSFAQAMSDVNEYAGSMSVASALISMHRAGAANAQKVKDQEAELVLQQLRTKMAVEEGKAADARLQTAQTNAKAAAIAPNSGASAPAAAPPSGK